MPYRFAIQRRHHSVRLRTRTTRPSVPHTAIRGHSRLRRGPVLQSCSDWLLFGSRLARSLLAELAYSRGCWVRDGFVVWVGRVKRPTHAAGPGTPPNDLTVAKCLRSDARTADSMPPTTTPLSGSLFGSEVVHAPLTSEVGTGVVRLANRELSRAFGVTPAISCSRATKERRRTKRAGANLGVGCQLHCFVRLRRPLRWSVFPKLGSAALAWASVSRRARRVTAAGTQRGKGTTRSSWYPRAV